MVYNILDLDPALAAKYHSDQDVLIAIFNIARDLSYIHHYFRSYFRHTLFKIPDIDTHQVRYYIDRQQMYEPVRYNWASQLLTELSNEYTTRFGKVHKLSRMIKVLKNNPVLYQSRYYQIPTSSVELRFSTMQLPNKFRCNDVVISHRAYYQGTRQFSRWNHSDKPEWWDIDQYQLVKQIRYKNNVATLSISGGFEDDSPNTSVDIPGNGDSDNNSLSQVEIPDV